jgi:nucleotide-binding universal stress UspA family protein
MDAWSLATLQAASEVAAKAGVQLVSEHAASPFERRSERFAQLARVNDLTILGAADAADALARSDIENAVFDSGRPVLIIPPRGGKIAPRRIAIAWDGSARAARAVKDAIGFLKAAQTVVAVTVTGEKDLSRMAPGADLAIYLARHGIECKIATLAGAQRDVGARIRLFVAEEDFDMIVMGAFVHSRFREAVLGGATRSLLDDCPVPLLLSH